MKKVICGLVLLVSLVLSGCSNSENHSKTDEYKYDKATFESKYDLIFLSYFNFDTEYERLENKVDIVCEPTDSYKDKNNDLTEISINGVNHKVKRTEKSYYDNEYLTSFYDRHYTSYSTTSVDDPISSIYVDDIGNVIIIDYNINDSSENKSIDIGSESRKNIFLNFAIRRNIYSMALTVIILYFHIFQEMFQRMIVFASACLIMVRSMQ